MAVAVVMGKPNGPVQSSLLQVSIKVCRLANCKPIRLPSSFCPPWSSLLSIAREMQLDAALSWIP